MLALSENLGSDELVTVGNVCSEQAGELRLTRYNPRGGTTAIVYGTCAIHGTPTAHPQS
eukprot:m.200477 g.200477  ORF g.200477 m.200477 type:complete len:59 (-) comp18794_c0_seq3:13-189(-)